MEFKVKGSAADKTIFFSLRETERGVTVCAVNGVGVRSNLITFIPNESCVLHSSVSPVLGIPLDDAGCIEVVD